MKKGLRVYANSKSPDGPENSNCLIRAFPVLRYTVYQAQNDPNWVDWAVKP